MAAGRLLNPPDHLQLSSGNVSQNWKRFKQKWRNYDLAIGIARKEDPIRVATFLTVIGDEALDVYNAFTWDSDEDKVKMDKVLEHFEQYCEPRKNTIYERYLFFSRGQESGEPIDKYATVLRNMADSCEFQDLKDSLIRDRIVFGIADNNVRERLLRVPDLTLNKALEIARAAEATQSQLKQMQNLHEVNAVGKKKEKFFRKKQEEKKKSANGSTQQIDCKFCGRKHVPDRSKCPAYGQQCNKCGKSNHFAAKCTGGRQTSRNLHANQNLNYVQEDSDGSQFEEYTIDVITYQVGAEELKSEVLSVKQEEYLIKSIEEISMVEFLPITSERLVDLRRKTELDEGLQQLKHIIKIGWPETKEEVPSEIRRYFDFKEELSIQDGILFKGNRVIVPVALRPHMITQVHSSHLGIESCLNKARDVLFWPGMTAEFRDCVLNVKHVTLIRQTSRKNHSYCK